VENKAPDVAVPGNAKDAANEGIHTNICASGILHLRLLQHLGFLIERHFKTLLEAPR
jgi:hypothetical protein